MKFCRDCRHRLQPTTESAPSKVDRCALREIAVCLVTGHVEHEFCVVMRGDHDFGECGSDAKLWEPL